MNPLPFLVSGLVTGSVYGLASLGLVFNYKVSRTLNFAYGAIAMFCAYCYWQMSVEWEWPFLASLAAATVVVPTVLALATEAVVHRRLAGGSVFARTAASVGILLAIYGVSIYFWSDAIAFGRLRPPSVFPRATVAELPGVNVSAQQLGVVLSVAVIVLLLLAFLKLTRWGVEVRAVVINRDLAELRGVDSTRATRIAWIGSYILAAASGVLIAPLIGGDPIVLTLIVVYSLAGAVLGGLVSLPLALLGGVLLGLSDSLILGYVPTGSLTSHARGVLPFTFLFVALIVQWRRLAASHDAGGRTAMLADLASAAFEHKAAPRKMLARVAPVLVAALLLQLFGLGYANSVLTTGVAVGIILLSYRVFTATTGLVSLAQASFAGLGAFTAANLVGSAGWPWLLALLAGAAVAAAAGALVALPTVRLRGVFLALATLAFAQLVERVVFTQDGFTGSLSGKAFPRPGILDTDFKYLIFLIGTFCLIGYLCERFQHSTIGRELQADLSSSPGARSIGIRPERGRLIAFMLAAAVAGLGGALLAGQVQHVSVEAWALIPAFVWLTAVAVGGVGSTGLMLQMGVVSAALPEIIRTNFPSFQRSYVALFGVLALLALRVPGGTAGMEEAAVRSIRRRLAGRSTHRSAAEDPPLDLPGVDLELDGDGHDGLHHMAVNLAAVEGREP